MHSVALLLCILLIQITLAQSPDSISSKSYPNPNKALRLSLILPGLGQAYNHSYWKIPLIYATLGTTAYFFISNHNQYLYYKEAYRNKIDGDSLTPDLFPNLDPIILRSLRDYYRRNRDLSVILGIVTYILNGIEAYVDAHLKPFDVSKNLTLHVAPFQFQLCYTISSPVYPNKNKKHTFY